jgi:hypothetical protein
MLLTAHVHAWPTPAFITKLRFLLDAHLVLHAAAGSPHLIYDQVLPFPRKSGIQSIRVEQSALIVPVSMLVYVVL